MHKKGITEEVAKKRSRKTVKHQRGIVGVGADLASLLAKKNQDANARAAERAKAIQKAKDAKKATEAKKTKAKASFIDLYLSNTWVSNYSIGFCCSTNSIYRSQGLEAAGQGWRRRSQGSLLDIKPPLVPFSISSSVPFCYATSLAPCSLCHMQSQLQRAAPHMNMSMH